MNTPNNIIYEVDMVCDDTIKNINPMVLLTIVQ